MSAVNNAGVKNCFPLYNLSAVKEKIAARIIPFYTLNGDLETIKGRVSNSPSYTLNDQERQKIKEAFLNCNKLFSGKLLETLSKCPPEEIKTVLFDILADDEKGSILTNLEILLNALDKDDLENFARIDSNNFSNGFEKDKLLAEKALKSVIVTKGIAIWKELSYQIFYFCHHLLETFIAMTGFTEIGSQKKHFFESQNMGSYEAKAKFELYLALLAYPSIVFASAYALIGSAAFAGVATVVVIIGSLLFIPIYIRYLRPCPNQSYGLENLNQKMLQSENPPPFLRNDILNRIQDAFCSEKAVILTGDAGAGKTSVAESLAFLIAMQKAKKGAEFLNKAQMFSANAHQIKGIGSIDILSLQSIGETFKDHKKNFVLFIDEIATLYEKNTLSGDAVKPLLTFLDKYKNVILATTTEEYQKFIANDEPMMRRAVHIKVESMSNNELEAALYQYLHFKAPSLILEAGTISYIRENAKAYISKGSEVDGAMSLLKSAINKATYITFDKIEKEINLLKFQIGQIENDLLHGDQNDVSEKVKEYREKQEELKGKQAELSKKYKALEQIKKIEALNLKVKENCYQLAKNNQFDQWKIKYALHEILTQFLANRREKLGLPEGINKKLIKSILVEKNLTSS